MKNDGVIKEGKLNEVITVITKRKNGSTRIQQDFEFCPTMAEQHTAHLTNINYLMETYQPDELAAYIAARSQYRQEIIGHDFSAEPSLQEAKNIIYKSKSEFEELDPEIKKHFKSHLEFLKFIDNPANEAKMLKMGIITKRQLDDIKIPEVTPPSTTQTTTLAEEDKAKKK